ncbi:MAG: TraR/DksA C4-type zinc finger protein [Bacteroidota bacterium]|nr:TraR/DksA C4-type zinc finger protein [Bacteroidota bacterium]
MAPKKAAPRKTVVPPAVKPKPKKAIEKHPGKEKTAGKTIRSRKTAAAKRAPGRTAAGRPPVPPAVTEETSAVVAPPTYGPEDLEHFKEIILEKIREANEELLSIEERLLDSSTGEYHDDDSTYSLHMADQGTDAMEREKAFLFAQRERKFISHLSDALQRIKSGNYGVCISCGNLIEKGRLEAVPHARMCVTCKNKTKSES